MSETAGPRAGAPRARLLVPAARLGLNWLVIAAAVGVAVWALVRIRLVVLPTLIAVLGAALLLPAVDALRRLRLPSVLAALTGHARRRGTARRRVRLDRSGVRA